MSLRGILIPPGSLGRLLPLPLPVFGPSFFSLPPPGGSLPPPGGLARLRALSLPFLVCWGGGVSFVAYRAQSGRVGGSRWGWVLQIKCHATE